MSKSSEKLFKIFVYGTLKRGLSNHHWLTSPENGMAKFLGIGTTVEKFPLIIGTRSNIPFLLDKQGMGHHVQGEVYIIDKTMLAKLDKLEDYPNVYDRDLQTIKVNDEIIPCWLYLLRKYPKKFLGKPHLSTYQNTKQNPYLGRIKSGKVALRND